MKKTWLLLLFILLSIVSSCGKDTTQLAKEEFAKYYNGIEEVVLNIDDNLYFENRVLERDKFSIKPSYGTLILYEEMIYYFTVSNPSKEYRNEIINIYSCDLFGNNNNLLHTQEINTNSDISKQKGKDCYYIIYKKDDLEYIDKYTIPTGIYENVDIGKNCNLENYFHVEDENRYNIEVIKNISPNEHGKFIITDLESGISNIIDDSYLNGTNYIDSMKKFNYSPKRVDFSNNHILLTYGIGAGDGWNYSYLVFEYDFDSNALEYKLLAFPYDNVPVDIIYIK